MNTMLEKRKQAVLVTKRCYFEKKNNSYQNWVAYKSNLFLTVVKAL